MNENNYIVYFKTAQFDFRVWHSDTQSLTTENIIPKNISQFYLSGKSYEANDLDLAKYGADIKKASDELSTSQHFTFNYLQPYRKSDGEFMYRSHSSNIESIFKMFSKGKLDDHAPITSTEAQWWAKCNNGGLIYSESGVYESHGYDFSNYYASILGDEEYFKIPSKPGKPKYLKVLPSKIPTGFYHVKIECSDPEIKKVFQFSKENVYCSLSLKFAIELQARFKIQIELVQDVEYNAYIYNLDSLVSSKKIFSKWYQFILNIKKEFPKNMLCKMISSSLWGHLSKSNTELIAEEEALKLKIGLTDEADYIINDIITYSNGSTKYELINSKQPYKYNVRLKPFITAFGRIKTAKIALLDLEHVIRIHTDSICFDKPMSFPDYPNFISESKSTGLIEFFHINKYQKIVI